MFRYIAFSAVACSQTLYFLFKVSLRSKRFRASSSRKLGLSRYNSNGNACYAGYFRVRRACKFLHFYSTLFSGILPVSVRGLPSYRKIPKISPFMYKPLQI